jgi:hypothetical protein
MSDFLIRRLTAAPARRQGPWDASRFALARVEHADLAPFATPAALAARLAVDDVRTHARFAIGHALVWLYQQDPCPLWSELLLRSYARLIVGVRAEVHLGRLQHHDVDQLVMTTFLDLSAKLDVAKAGAYVTHALGRDLRRDLFRALRRERRALEGDGQKTPLHLPRATDMEDLEARMTWASLSRAYEAPPVEHILLAHEGSLRTYLHETAPGSMEARERLYQRQLKAIRRFARRARADADAAPATRPAARGRADLARRRGAVAS